MKLTVPPPPPPPATFRYIIYSGNRNTSPVNSADKLIFDSVKETTVVLFPPSFSPYKV